MAEDLMGQYGLTAVLADMRSRKMRSSFLNFVAEVKNDVIPMKPKCPKGSLVQIADMPVNEDERRIEPFDERVLRNALTLKESEEKPKLPEWLNDVVSSRDVEGHEKRKEKKKKSKKDKKNRDKKSKRKREKAEGEGALNDNEKRLKKKRKKKDA